MDKLDKILHRCIKKKPLRKALESAEICFYADSCSDGRFRTISFSRGILKVSVDSSPAASELQFEEANLVERINKRAGQEVIKSIRIIVL
jgi:predicted nucleic acid-binding Zn ribbon protein